MIGNIKNISFANFKRQLFEQMEERCINREHDMVIVVGGNEGAGKTTFSLALAGVDTHFFENFQVYFKWHDYLKIQNDFIKYLNHLSPTTPINHGSVLVYDEAGTQLHARTAMANTDQVKMFIANRFLRLIHILNVPKLNSLDKYVREERIRMFIWIDYNFAKDKRTAYVYGKESISKLFNRPYWWQLFANTNWLITTVKPDYSIVIPILVKTNGYIPLEFFAKYKEEKAKFNLELTNDMLKSSTNNANKLNKSTQNDQKVEEINNK
jgi:energy-coupling factor transporter ATP-binding protein EcfA2